MTPTDQDGWKYAKHFAQIGKSQIACGVIQHPVTNNWHVWVSLYGIDIASLFASRNYGLADSVIQQFADGCNSRKFFVVGAFEKFATAVRGLEGSEPIDPLPQSTLQKIGKLIGEMKREEYTSFRG